MHELLSDGDITLRLARSTPGDPCREWVPALEYDILTQSAQVKVGGINLRLGYTLNLVRYGGNIGYAVDSSYRGHHYAGKACRLVRLVAIAHGMDVLWITCNPDNWASRKTCEWIGAVLVEVVDLPPENDEYASGERQKCRYRWVLY